MENKIIAYLDQGNIIDLHSSYDKSMNPIYMKDAKAQEIFRHSGAHLLANALNDLYPGTQFATGPDTEYGFFYDFKLPNNEQLSEKNMGQIIKKMDQIIKMDSKITKDTIDNNKARDLFASDKLKMTIVEKLIKNNEKITIYSQNNFYDLCRGPHLPSTGYIPKYFKFKNLSEVSFNDQRIQRLSFYHFYSQEQLDEYIKYEQLALNHKKIGPEKELFHLIPEASGFALWDQYGVKMRRKLRDLILKTTAYDFHEVETPAMMNRSLWKKTGHLSKYSEYMYQCEDLCMKPMNCPAHNLFMKSLNLSYKQLPYRIFEFGVCFRNEAAGGLQGLKRMRNFEQDDGHIACTIDQVNQEVNLFLERSVKLYNILGFNNIKIVLSTRPEKYIGEIEQWNQAEKYLEQSIKEKYHYTISPGEGAFYGPKIELHIQDSLGKYWQCGTLQVDFFIAKNLNLTFMNKAGRKEHPIILHRATLGSLERFIAIMLEKNITLPDAINPYKVVILPIKNADISKIIEELEKKQIKYLVDESMSIGKLKHKYKHINKAIIIVGPKEIDQKKSQLIYKNFNEIIDIEHITKIVLEN